MKIFLSCLVFLCSITSMAQPGRGSITEKELKDLAGNWAGTMVYTGDSSQITSVVALEVVDMKDSLVFNYTFTHKDGKQVKEKNSLRIYEEGNKLSFDSAQFDIVSTRRRGIRLTIIAERVGVENFRSADFQETINMGPGIFNYTKGIRYMDMSEAYLIRKRVTLTKK